MLQARPKACELAVIIASSMLTVSVIPLPVRPATWTLRKEGVKTAGVASVRRWCLLGERGEDGQAEICYQLSCVL